MGEVFKLNHCYNMDCLPAMELFPDNYFDLAVVDPPYFSGPERRGFYGSKVSKIGVHRDYPVSPAWSKPEPEYFRELFRVCRHYNVSVLLLGGFHRFPCLFFSQSVEQEPGAISKGSDQPPRSEKLCIFRRNASFWAVKPLNCRFCIKKAG